MLKTVLISALFIAIAMLLEPASSRPKTDIVSLKSVNAAALATAAAAAANNNNNEFDA